MAPQTTPRPNGHALRSAATRGKLIDATVECLHRLGFGATTTVAVTAQAGVSRGAMLHHFPTRADLILATAEHIVRDQDARRRATLRQLPRGQARFAAITDVVWETMKEPESVALLEIMLGARSDPELAARMPAVLQTVRGNLVAGPKEVAHDVGIEDLGLVTAMSTLHLAAMRGLAIERLLAPDDPGIDEAYDLLLWYKELVTKRLLGREIRKDSLD